MDFIIGQKMKLNQISGFNDMVGNIQVGIQATIDAEIDVTCFGIDSDRKLSDDRYMIFYNQMQSPQKEIKMIQNEQSGNITTAMFDLNLKTLPDTIKCLSFAATIDGTKTMNELHNINVQIAQNGNPLVNYRLTGTDFNQEKTIILFEIYYHQEWRINAVGRGFNGGLEVLLKDFGTSVEVVKEKELEAEAMKSSLVAEISAVSDKKVSLEKRIEKEAPELVSLVKSAKVSLEKAGLSNHTAKVALCLDISASMSAHYHSGEIQKFAERILALGTRFDDDGSIDIFLFGKNGYYAGECTIENYHGYITDLMKNYRLEGRTNYQTAIRMIRKHYMPKLNLNKNIVNADMPVYVMFLTDGDATDRLASETEMILTSYEPIFWGFMGIGKGAFRFLEKLDDLKGRCLDNASLLKAGKPSDMTDERLYDEIMKEYKNWVPMAKGKGMI